MSNLDLILYIRQELNSVVANKLRNLIETVQSRQSHLVPNSTDGFWYRGHKYGKLSYRCAPLHPSLYADMEHYLAQDESSLRDKAYINSYLGHVLSIVPKDQIHHLLPEPLHTVLRNRGVAFNPTPPDNVDEILSHNQKGYDLLLVQLLNNIVG